MLEQVLDALLARLETQPTKVVGVTTDGQELRVERRTDCAPAPRGAHPSVSVSLRVPEAPTGSVHIVLCRWDDLPGILMYPSLEGDASRPQWKHLELIPDGVRLVVKWEHEEKPRDYSFEWVRKALSA